MPSVITAVPVLVKFLKVLAPVITGVPAPFKVRLLEAPHVFGPATEALFPEIVTAPLNVLPELIDVPVAVPAEIRLLLNVLLPPTVILLEELVSEKLIAPTNELLFVIVDVPLPETVSAPLNVLLLPVAIVPATVTAPVIVFDVPVMDKL